MPLFLSSLCAYVRQIQEIWSMKKRPSISDFHFYLHFHSCSFASGTTLSSLHILTSLILLTLWSKYCHNFHLPVWELMDWLARVHIVSTRHSHILNQRCLVPRIHASFSICWSYMVTQNQNPHFLQKWLLCSNWFLEYSSPFEWVWPELIPRVACSLHDPSGSMSLSSLLPRLTPWSRKTHFTSSLTILLCHSIPVTLNPKGDWLIRD